MINNPNDNPVFRREDEELREARRADAQRGFADQSTPLRGADDRTREYRKHWWEFWRKG